MTTSGGSDVERHPRFLTPAVLLATLPLCVLGSLIGTQLLVRLGVTTNTAVIGALAAIGLGRIPLGPLVRFRSIHVQNLVQSAVSASTFGAANSLLLPIGIPFALGRPDLIWPMLAGAIAAMLLDATMLYRMFGSHVFPATGAWPPGVAAAETIAAGDEGGQKMVLLGVGVALGVAGSLAGIPMSGFGVAFIGNPVALLAFGIGLLVAGYFGLVWPLVLHLAPFLAGTVPDGRLAHTEIPQGLMLGAGLAALVQVVFSFAVRRRADTVVKTASPVRDGPALGSILGVGAVFYLVIAVGMATLGGFWARMPVAQLAAFVVYAALAALLHELIIGLAAMHSGWFPAFAVAVVSLGVGLLIGFPPGPLALLTGFTACTGPAFADMGCDLKAGYLLRGEGADLAFEADGRWQQYIAAIAALLVASVVVMASFHLYFARHLIAPVDRTFVAAIRAGIDPSHARSLLVWALPGAAIQLLGGPGRQVGILFATGLLLASPLAGIAVLCGLAIRFVWLRRKGETARPTMQVAAAGTIAGDAVAGFGTALF